MCTHWSKQHQRSWAMCCLCLLFAGPLAPGHAQSRSNRAALIVADVRGSKEPELVATDAESMTIYTNSGAYLAEYALPQEGMIAAFARDFDGDGKQDILFGTADAPTSQLFILNGMGRIIFRFTLEDLNLTFSHFLPQAFAGGLLYAVCNPAWARSPRGIMAVDTKTARMIWMYYTPSVPLTVRSLGGDTPISVSINTLDNSTFLNYGKDRTYLPASDTFIRHFSFTPSGDTLSYAEVHVPERVAPPEAAVRPDGRISGTGHFYPLQGRTDTILLHHIPGDGMPGPGVLYLTDAVTSEAIGSYLPRGGSLLAAVPGQGRNAGLIFAAADLDGALQLMRLDMRLEEELRVWVIDSPPYSEDPETTLEVSGDLLLLRRGSLAAVFDGGLRPIAVEQVYGLKAASIIQRPEGIALAVFGKEVTVVPISESGP